jgi:triosephosphate isomerase
MAKKRIVAGNWKMLISSRDDARSLALGLRKKLRGITGVDVYVAPPVPFLFEVAGILETSPIRVGAQTLSSHKDGAHTGEVSGAMLKGAGAQFSIVGHSERREAGESESVVRAELEQAIDAGLAPMLCIGERSRDEGGEQFSTIERQIISALKDIPKNTLKKLIIAYEPVWAIGKRAEDAMKPADLEEMVIFIRKVLAELLDRTEALKVPILYGGSVDAQNAQALVKEGGANGFLVGRASASLDSFLAIIAACK